ncbi:A24 family peptidase [Chitinimonas sp.]|uniref:prepilin peptidase n=1 Tax=Chitinimonas sp. TaxID=1934313 RepID=UPI0035B31E1C
MGFVDLTSLAPIVLFFVLGLIFGSFLNVVIHRLPKMMELAFEHDCAAHQNPESPAPAMVYNLAVPRSACPTCGTPIRAMDNIPVVSWIFLRGKCHHCKAPISARYPLVELITGVMSALIIASFGPTLGGIGAVVFCWFLIALFFIDLDTYLLPDSLTLPLLWLGLLININGTFAPLNHAVIGAVAGYLSLWSIYWLFKLLTGKEGMGYGDFKLLAALGAWLGWQALPLVILASSLVGAIVGIAFVTIKSKRFDNPIPFGPFLALAGLITLVWRTPLTQMIWG